MLLALHVLFPWRKYIIFFPVSLLKCILITWRHDKLRRQPKCIKGITLWCVILDFLFKPLFCFFLLCMLPFLSNVNDSNLLNHDSGPASRHGQWNFQSGTCLDVSLIRCVMVDKTLYGVQRKKLDRVHSLVFSRTLDFFSFFFAKSCYSWGMKSTSQIQL